MSGLLRGCKALFTIARVVIMTNISPSATKKASSSAATASKLLMRGKEKKPSSSGIMRATTISPTLQSVISAPEASRAEAVKKLWEYIKLHNLQNPLDKREIFCDAKLKKLFDRKDKVGFLQIRKLLSPYFVKTG